MSNIPTIKSMLNILDIAEKVVELRKGGKSYKGLCPFHNDRNPSFVVYPESNRYVCFGCGASGSALDLYAYEKGISIKEAVNILEAEFGLNPSFNPIHMPITNEEIEMLHLIPSKIRRLYIDDPEGFAYIVGERVKNYIQTWDSMHESLEIAELKVVAKDRLDKLLSIQSRIEKIGMEVGA